MKKISLFLAFSIYLFFSHNIFSQTFEVPTNYVFKTKEDFAKYEKDIIQAINWLETTPIDKQSNKRKGVNAFLISWLTGSPNVSIALTEYTTELSSKNPDLLISFMGGWTKEKLQNPSLNDVLKLNIAGVKSIIKTYKLGGAKKDKNVEKLLLMDDQQLENWCRSKVK